MAAARDSRYMRNEGKGLCGGAVAAVRSTFAKDLGVEPHFIACRIARDADARRATTGYAVPPQHDVVRVGVDDHLQA